MVLKAKTRLYHIADKTYAIYIPLEIARDSQFPFNLKEACEKGALEIVVMPTKIEGLGKLLIRLAPKTTKQKV